jgi:hypothetical protein
MPTENRRIATYLPKGVDEKFQAFKLERGIKGDSHALLTVLSEFLGVAESIAPPMTAQYEELSKQFNGLQSKLTALESRLFSRLKSELLVELSKSSLLAISDPVIEISQSGVREAEFQVHELTYLTGRDLSLRLNIRSDAANRWRPGRDRAKLPDELLKATRKKDPDGIGWSYLPEIDKFQSEKPLPALALSELPVFSSSDPAEDF